MEPPDEPPTEQQSRRWFAAASSGFVELVASCPVARLSEPALGEWSLRDVIGHASRAYLTLEDYLAVGRSGRAPELASGRTAGTAQLGPTGPTGPIVPRLDGPTAYLQASRHGLADPAAVRERGRLAGEALGPAPAEAVGSLAARVGALLAATPGTAVVATPVGRMVLADYLPTRAFELTVHGLDIARAVGRRPPAALRVALRPALHLCADLLTGDDRSTVLLALTGRTALPYRFSLV